MRNVFFCAQNFWRASKVTVCKENNEYNAEDEL
jgi:hypothetical protein